MGPTFVSHTRVDPATQRQARRLAEQMSQAAHAGLLLPGSLTHRYSRCGRAGCKCTAEVPQPHGPYWSWTRKVNNKTVTRYLSAEQLATYQPMFDNTRRVRELLTAMEALGLSVADADPRWRR